MVVESVGMDAALALVAVNEGPNSLSMYAGGSSGLYINRCGEGDWMPVAVAGADGGGYRAGGCAVWRRRAGDPGRREWRNHQAIAFHSDSMAIPLSSPPPLVTCLAGWRSGEFGNRLLAGTLVDGVYWSDDRGCTWAPANTGLLDMSVYALVCASGATRS